MGLEGQVEPERTAAPAIRDGSRVPAHRASIAALFLALLAFSGAACKEGGTIKVHSLKFNGVTAVDERRLRDALTTWFGPPAAVR